jgi:hypothetical protein
MSIYQANFSESHKYLLFGDKLFSKNEFSCPWIYIAKTEESIKITKIKDLILIVRIKNFEKYLMKNLSHI